MNAISSDKGTSPTGLTGTLTVPGDKSISHRALMIGALAVGETTITGLLEGEDVLATAAAMQQLGAEIEQKEGTWHVTGRGIGGLIEPAGVLDLGNSGTAARLLMGVLASHDLTATMTGDASLSSRPMERVMEPLRHIGAEFTARSGGQLPITITGTPSALPGDETLKVASAQVKSAILLAGLNAAGNTIVVEPRPSRDHTEKMLSFFGADVRSEENTDGSRKITLVGQPEITGRDIVVPGDISSAAFPIVAALITPGSDVTIENVGINPLRAGLLDSLSEMGADIEIKNTRDIAGEPVADLQVRASQLKGATIPASRAPAMIDEYPILAVAAACAEGTSIFEGVGELRVKESDRLAAMAEGLQECGVETAATEDTLTIYGTDKIPGKIAGGVTIASQLDHRIAMSYLVLGLASENPVTIDDGSPIETSFPGFLGLMNKLGATMAEAT
ncbi:MAG: 3-phosphoshikimate 1-carboxyvinyltransferase [Rhodospirillaceae bacterium]|nr:3-phosphoshikimate 1-carboxyvinyltransferase [Rhodospirillaceae bacterium]MBT4937569.1 3-phosphoshikimate 1-carboxyvinyltransferase [Rhodospirillaceae bacterium]MBT7266763.1 3-phosphoshikimate 1-carboxyvinyltransferase [Rhodospirillaceae bacterium]